MYWHDEVVYLCVRLWRCALQLNDTSYKKSVWASEQEVPPKSTILQLLTPYSDPVASNVSPLEPKMLVPSGE